jgi:hypothetical protein
MRNGWSRILAVGAVTAAFSVLALAPIPAAAQTSNLPPRTHTRETGMSLKAHEMQKRVAEEITAAKGKGENVSLAEKHKDEGDRALEAGHLRIAVEHYEAAQKALGK